MFSPAEQTNNVPFSMKMEDVCRKAPDEVKGIYEKAKLSNVDMEKALEKHTLKGVEGFK